MTDRANRKTHHSAVVGFLILVEAFLASAVGSIKIFPLRGIRDSPLRLHEGRVWTLENTVEFFDRILGARLGAVEKSDRVALR